MTTQTNLKGLILDIFRSDYDCPINKLTGKKSVVLIDDKMPKIFNASADMPAVRLVTRNLFGNDYTHAEPMEKGNYAFGGSFIYTSDSRLKEVATYPIPLHDRQMDLERPTPRPKVDYSYLKEDTNKSATGTSFHDTTIKATVNQLSEILGQPTFEQNDGEDKVNFEWERLNMSGNIFTVYDWKEYRSIGTNEEIVWHIGGFNAMDTHHAKDEIESALKALVNK